uniref:Thap2 protein n=1 Tax=Fopius arisanus TaxID=64838 RepID=A0A0C9R0H3_9HYME
MPTTCIVSSCKAGYRTNPERVSFFSIPKDKSLRDQWARAIRRDKGDLKSHHRVCSKHFRACDIILHKKFMKPDGEIIAETSLNKSQLREGAVPMIFLGAESCKRVSLESSESINLKTNSLEICGQVSVFLEAQESLTVPAIMSNNNDDQTLTPNTIETLINSKIDEQTLCSNLMAETLAIPMNDTQNISSINGTQPLFLQIIKNKFQLPAGWCQTNYNYEGSQVVVFSQTELRHIHGTLGTMNIKEIVINSKLELTVKALHHPIDLTTFHIDGLVTDVNMVQGLIFTVHNFNICYGCAVSEILENIQSKVTFKDCMNTLRHKNCQWLTKSSQCIFCAKGKRTLKRKCVRLKEQPKPKRMHLDNSVRTKKLLNQKKDRICNFRKTVGKLRVDNQKLRKRLEDSQKQVAGMKEETLAQVLGKHELNKHHETVVWEIFNAAKRKGLKGNRYGEDWLMICALVHMKSSSTYRFIYDNNILPVPSVSTIKRNLRAIKAKCGFDPEFFKLFAEFLSAKTQEERHGFILLDEMFTRQSIAVNSQTLSFAGLEDFGD